MSALAQILLARGYTVSGSDRDRDRGMDLDVLRKLERKGVRLHPQDGSAIGPWTAALVVSTAIEADNPDIQAATRWNVPVQHRAECLASHMEGGCSVAVTGTSGKSTVTGMIGWMLDRLGADPVVVNGGCILNWIGETSIGNARIPLSGFRGEKPLGSVASTGQDGSLRFPLWVFEADESDRSLLRFSLDWAVVTNVSCDHFPREEAQALFTTFRSRARCGVVDEEATAAILAQARPRLSATGSVFHFCGDEVHLSLLGFHNVCNAVLALALVEKLGFPRKAAAAALGSFRGIHRRLEIVACIRGITVIDDYAHNPAKIRATWEALHPFHSRLWMVWQPHGYGPLKQVMDELVDLFAGPMRGDDHVLILPIYDAGGTADRTVRVEDFVARLQKRGCLARFVPEVTALPPYLAAEARSGEAIVIMGARDPRLPRLARAIVSALDTRD